jgi:hypothetical protein
VTVLAGLATGGTRPMVVLASDDSIGHPTGAPWEAGIRNKLFPLSDRRPIAAACGGSLAKGNGSRVVTMASLAAAFREAADAHPERTTVEQAAYLWTDAIHQTFGPAWPPGSDNAAFGYVCGFDPGKREPRCFWFLILPDEGRRPLERMAVAGPVLAWASPVATVAAAAARAITRAPRSFDHGAQLLRGVIERQIAYTEKHPSPDLTASGPVHALALTPDSPPLPC